MTLFDFEMEKVTIEEEKRLKTRDGLIRGWLGGDVGYLETRVDTAGRGGLAGWPAVGTQIGIGS